MEPQKNGQNTGQIPDPVKVEKDATQARINRCAPIAKQILQSLVDKNLLLSDVSFVERLVKEQFEVIAKYLVFLHMKDVFDLVKKSLEYAVNQAHKAQWGKDLDDVTTGDVDKVLKENDAKRAQ